MKKFKTLMFVLAITIGLAGTFAFTSKGKSTKLSTTYHYVLTSTSEQNLKDADNWVEGESEETCITDGSVPCNMIFEGGGSFQTYLNSFEDGPAVIAAADARWSPSR
jgi:hypothetical protein